RPRRPWRLSNGRETSSRRRGREALRLGWSFMEADAKSGKGFCALPAPLAGIIPAAALRGDKYETSAKPERGLQLVHRLAQAGGLVLELRILVDDAGALGPLLRARQHQHAAGRHHVRLRHALVLV